MKLIHIIRKLINPLKLDLKIYPNLDLRRRKKLLDYYKITKVLDVGANAGQYANQIFELGFTGNIVSFEPLKKVYKELEKQVKKNNQWSSFNIALGNKNEELEINVSKNTYSSSILEILPSHVKSAPESEVVNKEKITVKRLDDVYRNLVKDGERVLLKIDVQGFEKHVLEGAKKVLNEIKGIQIEMSVEELYNGELLFLDMIMYLNNLGFSLHSLENGFYDEQSGKLLQVDGIFFRD